MVCAFYVFVLKEIGKINMKLVRFSPFEKLITVFALTRHVNMFVKKEKKKIHKIFFFLNNNILFYNNDINNIEIQ